MISGNELRKGSCVKLHNNICYVSQLMLNKLEVQLKKEGNKEYLECLYEELEPVPLTPEIILKCGWLRHERFPHRDIFYSKKGDFIINVMKGSSELSFGLNGNFSIISNHNLSVHQFQNIYFALSNQELEIDL